MIRGRRTKGSSSRTEHETNPAASRLKQTKIQMSPLEA